jgi:hypothetical protein
MSKSVVIVTAQARVSGRPRHCDRLATSEFSRRSEAKLEVGQKVNAIGAEPHVLELEMAPALATRGAAKHGSDKLACDICSPQMDNIWSGEPRGLNQERWRRHGYDRCEVRQNLRPFSKSIGVGEQSPSSYSGTARLTAPEYRTLRRGLARPL